MATSDPKSDSKPAGDRLSADLEKEIAEIRADLAALTKTLGRYGKDRAGELGDQASDMTKDMVDEAVRLLRGLRNRLGEVEAEAEASLRDHPNQWVGGFLGVLGLGILLGLLFRRRD
jgi:ElaB/YqjD/DUF883 family membrane-anchored ribosome-binding protein